MCICTVHMVPGRIDCLFIVYIAYNITNGASKCWSLGNRSSALKCPGCTWASWSLPAPASPLRASVSPPPCSCCLLGRPSDSSDYEHKSSTCQERLLPGLCNVPAFIWRCREPGIAPNVLRPCKCYPGISLALMRGLLWWQWVLETMKIFRVQERTLNVGYSSARLSFHFFF